MTNKDSLSEKTDELRRHAEAIIREKSFLLPESLETLSLEESQRMLYELQVHQIELEMQNEELRQTQVKLSTEQQRYFDFYDLAPVGYFTLSQEGLILEVNFTASTMLGENRGQLIKMPISPFILSKDQDSYYLHLRQLFATGKPQTFELRMVKKDRTIFWAHLATTTEQDDGGKQVCRIVLTDITARKFRDDQGELATLLITQITAAVDFRQCLATLTTSLQGWSGCEAVGIRLRSGDDYPYFETRGFPAAFVQAESQLCAYDRNGKLLCDAAGAPVLECMCGNILSGRFDPSKPFFSIHGSFWTNSTTALIASTTDADRQARIRNRCNSAGYESVALIPLRDGKQVFGLLQFNDHQPNRFTADLIAHLERMADTLAISLSRRQTEELLRESEERFRSIIENSTAGYFFIDLEGRFKTVNAAWLRLHKYDASEEIVGCHFSVTQIDRDKARANETVERLLTDQVAASGEFSRRCKDGSVGWHTFTLNPVWQGGKVIGIEGFLIDITEDKVAEEKLSKIMREQQIILDTANIGIAKITDRKLTWVNQKIIELFQSVKEEMEGQSTLQFFPTEEAYEKMAKDAYLVLAQGLTHGTEQELLRRDGTSIRVRLNAKAIDPLDISKGSIWLFEDVTERNQAANALRNLNAYNRSLFEVNLDSLVTIDPEGKISDVNSATEHATGYARQELIGTDFSNYFTEPEKARQGYQRVFQEGLVRDYPLEIRHHDGHVTSVLYNATVYRDDLGNVSGVFASARDITKRRQAEEALQEKNALLSLFMKYSPVYTFIKEVTTTESRVVMASENFKDMIGIPGSAMVGKTMEDLFSAEFAAKITADDWAVISSGNTLTLDEHLKDRNYTTIKFPVSLGSKNLLAGYTIDITERKMQEEEKEKLEAQNRQLQKAESIGRMAGAIAHHFNNKLHVVMGYLEMSIAGLPPGDTNIANLQAASLAADKAAEVSRMMLTYLGQITGPQKSADISEICRKSLAQLQVAMPNNVDLKTDLHFPGPIIKANTKQIEQIISNLVTNGWEAIGDKQGTIQLTTKPASLVDIATLYRYPVNWQPDDCQYACLEVRDTGCGIAGKDLDEVFVPFYSTKFTGRGLGLPVVLGLVQVHNGVITIESLPGEGSVFRIFFPMVAEENCHHSPDKPINLDDFQEGGTVLLVDDDEIVLNITNEMLLRLGFNVLTARDGIEAVAVFQRHKDEIRFILCDVAMPRMSGWETLTALRQIVPDIKVILASGYSEEQVMDGIDIHAERPQSFLGKPYGFEALKKAILAAL